MSYRRIMILNTLHHCPGSASRLSLGHFEKWTIRTTPATTTPITPPPHPPPQGGIPAPAWKHHPQVSPSYGVLPLVVFSSSVIGVASYISPTTGMVYGYGHYQPVQKLLYGYPLPCPGIHPILPHHTALLHLSLNTCCRTPQSISPHAVRYPVPPEPPYLQAWYPGQRLPTLD